MNAMQKKPKPNPKLISQTFQKANSVSQKNQNSFNIDKPRIQPMTNI